MQVSPDSGSHLVLMDSGETPPVGPNSRQVRHTEPQTGAAVMSSQSDTVSHATKSVWSLVSLHSSCPLVLSSDLVLDQVIVRAKAESRLRPGPGLNRLRR